MKKTKIVENRSAFDLPRRQTISVKRFLTQLSDSVRLERSADNFGLEFWGSIFGGLEPLEKQARASLRAKFAEEIAGNFPQNSPGQNNDSTQIRSAEPQNQRFSETQKRIY